MSHATPHPARTAIGLSIGVLALSSAAILIRLAADAPSLAIAFWRVALSAILLVPFALGRAPRKGMREVLEALRHRAPAIGGVALGLHFWAWMHSLTLTSVASSTLFVTTTPFWIALASPWLPHEARPTRRVLAGMLVCFLGGLVLGSGAWSPGDLNGTTDRTVSAEGIAWAIVGAWLAAAYLVAARAGRQRFALAPFAVAAYTTAATTLATLAVITQTPLAGWGTTAWLAILALAVFPQLLGHNALLWAVRATGAAVVALAVLTEPVGATLLAWGFLGESPSPTELVGGTLLLSGLALAVTKTSRPTDHAPNP